MIEGVEKSTGIVLLDERQRRYLLTVLDQSLGKIQAVVSRCRYSASLLGMVVEYERASGPRGIRLQALEPVLQPHYLSYEHQKAFHQLLDITLHVLPHQAGADDVFNLLIQAVQKAAICGHDERIMKLVIGSVLYAAGFYEPGNLQVDRLVNASFDELIEHAPQTNVRDLDAMIINSLRHYPYFNQMKTLRFLKGV